MLLEHIVELDLLFLWTATTLGDITTKTLHTFIFTKLKTSTASTERAAPIAAGTH